MLDEFKRECPRCYTNRTMLDTKFALPGYLADCNEVHTKVINEQCVLPVRVVLCPRCHLIELHHDVG